MATQADIPEDILHKKLEVEHTGLTIGQFERTVDACFPAEVTNYESQINECPETQECQAESENKQVACSTQVEVTNNVVNGNSGTSEGGSFLASPSGPNTSNKGASGPEDCQVDEHRTSALEISNTAEHVQKGQKFEAVEETAREVVAEEGHQGADQVEKNLGQNVEVIPNQKDSVDQGSGSIEKETNDSENDEREISHFAELPEVTLDHKDFQSVVETCSREQNEDNISSTETTLLKEDYTEKRSFEENEEEDKCVDLMSKGKDSEAICSTEAKGTEDEKNQITNDNAGDAAFSIVALSYKESQNNDNSESVKDVFEGITVTEEPGDQKAGTIEKEKHEEVPDPACSQDANELSREETVEPPTENEMQKKDSSVALVVEKAEEACSQEKDIPEIPQVSSEIRSEHNTKESLIEITKQTAMLEETTDVKSTASGDININENSEEELEIPYKKPEEVDIREKDKEPDITEVAVEEVQNTKGSSPVAAEDISTVKLFQTEELTEAESTKLEDHPDVNLLPQSEPEEEQLQAHFNVVSEEIKSIALGEDAITVIPIKEEVEIKSPEESFKESEKKEEPIPVCDVRNDIPSEEITNLPLTKSEIKTESTEAALLNNDENNSNATHLLVEQAEVQGEKIDEVSKLKSHEKDEVVEKEKKHVEADSEGHQSTEKTIVTSTEGIAPQEIIFKEGEKTEEPEKDSGVSSKEGLESQDAGESELEEIKKEAEITDTDVQKFTSSQESEKSLTIDDIPAEVDYIVRGIPEPEPLEPTGEDEGCKQESIRADFEKGTSKSSEDNVMEADKPKEEESTAELIKEGNTNDLSLKNIHEAATAMIKDSEHEANKSEEEVLEELETVGADESTPCEAKDIESTVEASLVKQEGQHKEGEYVNQTEALIEESRVKIAKEETLNSSGEDEGHTQESIEGNVNKEQIIEKDVTFSTRESVQDKVSKSSQHNTKDAENLYEEESTVGIIKEGKVDDLSTENTQEDATKTLEGHENEAEKSNEEVVEKFETARAGESTPSEMHEDVESYIDASSLKKEEVKDKDQDQIEALIGENKVEIAEKEVLQSKHEDESHRQEAESNKEQIIEEDAACSVAESIQEETSKISEDNVKDGEKSNEEESTAESIPENNQEHEIIKLNDHENETEKCKEEVLQESETTKPSERISFEADEDVEKFVKTSSIKQEEGQEEEGDYGHPIKASIEENKVETPEEEALESKGEDESNRQENTLAGFDKEQFVGEVTFSTAEPTQEETSTSSQDNIKEAEKLSEEHPAEITKESKLENTPEEAIEVLKDHENEGEKSNEEVRISKEVAKESETTEPSENSSFETNKDVEEFLDVSLIKQDEGQEEEGKSIGPIGASIEENIIEVPEEKASKLGGDYENYRHECAGADFNKEQIMGKEVAFSNPKSTQDETSKSSQDNIKDPEKINEEHQTEITKESDINDFSPENIQEDAIEASKNHENEEEKPKEEVVEGLETARRGESIPSEPNKDVERSEDAASVKQEEPPQEESKYLEKNKPDFPEDETSKSRGDIESDKQERTGADFNKEQIVEREVTFHTTESVQEEKSKASQGDAKKAEIIDEESTTEITKEGKIHDPSLDANESLKDHDNEAEKSKEEVVEELEAAGASESIPRETNKDVESFLDASPRKEEEGRQEEGKYIDPNGASVEENKVEIYDEEASKSITEDQSHRQESTGADFNKERIVREEVIFSIPESSQEDKSKSCQDNIKDVETTNEEPLADITKEDTNETLKDHESKIGKSKEKVVQEIETGGPSESIPRETNKDVEGFVDASLSKQEESQQEEVKYLYQVQASIEENKIEDKFSTEEVKDDEDDNKVTVTEREIESKSEEEQQAVQKDNPEKKLEILHNVTPEETPSEKSSKIARELTSVDVEGTIQDLNDTSETEKEGEKSKNVDDTNDSEREIPKVLETAAGECSPCKISEDAESSVDASSVKQEESQQEVDQVEALKEDNKVEENFTAELVKYEEENKESDASSKGEQVQQQATQTDEHEEKLELRVTPKETEPDTSTEYARRITSMEVEGTAQNLEETSETEKTKHVDTINDSEEIPKELETAGASESSPCKQNEDIERSVDASFINQEEIPPEEGKYLDQVEASIEEKKVDDIYSPEVARDDDDSKVEVPEKRIEVVSKDEEDQQQATKKDEPGEKLEDLLHVTPEESETQPSSEIAREITCAEVDGTVRNLEKTSETENEGKNSTNKDGTSDSEKKIPKELETAGAGASIPCKINDDAENSVDASSSKQEDNQQEQVKYTDQVEASMESNKLEETSTSEEAKDDDKNKVSDVASKGEEEGQKYEPGEKLEKLLHVTPEETKTEASTENARNITSMRVEGTAQKVEGTSERENPEHIDGTNDSEREIPQELQTDGTSESIPRETNEHVERSVVTASVKQEDRQEEDKELEQIETSKEENKVEDSFSTEVGKDDYDKKDKVIEREIEEDRQQATQKEEPGKKHEYLLQVMPKKTETETSRGNATNVTCMHSEGTIQVVEETSETESNEEKVLETTSASQETREEISREIESVEEFSQKCLDTETIEETEDITVEESWREPERVGKFKEEEKRSESKERNEVTDLIEEIKPGSLEDIAKPNDDLCTTIITEVSVTEAPETKKFVEEEIHEKEPAVDAASDSRSAGLLAEETSVKEAKLDDKEEIRSYEIVVEEKGLENNEVQSESVLNENLSGETGLNEGEPDKEGSNVASVSTEVVSKETCLEEAKLDDEEQIKSSDNALEEKGQERSVDVDVQSDFASTRIVGEETSSKEVEQETVEEVKSSDVASEEKSLASNVIVEEQSNSVSTAIVGEETVIEEAKQDREDQVKNADSGHEEKSFASNLDTEIVSEKTTLKEAATNNEDHVQSHDFALEQEGLVSETQVEIQSASIATEIVSEEAEVKEAKRDHEEHVNSSDTAFEVKSLESSLDTEIVSDETSLKEAASDNDNHVQSRDFALEKEGLLSEAEVEIESAYISAEIVSEETGVNEAKDNREYQVSSSEIAFEENSPESSLDTKIVSEETSFKEVKSKDGVQVKDSAPEKVESDSVSAGIESEETCLKEDKPSAPEQENLVSGKTDLKQAESDNHEEVKNYDIAAEEKEVASNVVSDAQEKEISESEENELNKAPEVTGECEEKIEQERTGETPIAGTEDKEQDTKAETPLEDSSEYNLQDSSIVPSIKHEPVTAGESERSDETTAIDKTESENVNLPIIEPKKDVQEEDDSELKKVANKEIQKQRDDELSMPPEIITKDAIPTEGHEGIEKVVESESRREHVTDREINLEQSHAVSNVDERVYKDNDSGPIVTEFVKATSPDEHISCTNWQSKENATKENVGEVDTLCDKDDTATVRDETTVANLGEAQPVETDSEERNLVLQKSVCDMLPGEKVESVVKLEERSFDVDQKETERQPVVEESCAINDVEKAKPAVEKLEMVESKEEIKEVSAYQGIKAVNEDEMKSEPDPDDGISKGQEHETETTVQISEEVIKEVECQDKEKIEASSATYLEREVPIGPEPHEVAEETEKDVKRASETVFESNYETIHAMRKDEVNADQDRHIGVSTGQGQELETTEVVKKTEEEAREDSLVAEKAEETILKEETEEEIAEAPTKVSNSDTESIKVATAHKTIEDQALLPVTSKDELQVLPPKEEDNENTSNSPATKTEEPREIKASDSIIDVSGSSETQAEIKRASKMAVEFGSQSIGDVTEEKKITCETPPENTSEVQLLEQSYVLLHKEQEDGIRTTAKEIEEQTTAETCSKKEVLAADKTEDIIEVSEAVFEENSPATEVSEEVFNEEALPVIKLITDQALKTPSSSTPVSADEMIREEKTKEEAKLPDDKNVEDSSSVKTVEGIRLSKEDSGRDVWEVLNEVTKVGGGKVTKIEPQESQGDTREVESPSDRDKDLDTKEAVTEASNLNTEKGVMDSDLVSEKVKSPEARTSIEEVEIIENHLMVATTELRTEEPQYKSETTFQEEKTTENEISNKEELSTEISQGKGGLDVKEVGEIVQETKQLEESSHAICKEQTPTEDKGKESLETRITTSDEDVRPTLTDPVEETLQMAEPKDIKPGNDVSLNREITGVEIKKEESLGEKETGGSITDAKPAVISLSEIMQSSKKETAQVAEHSTEERVETTKNGREADKTKTDDEKDEEEENEEDDHEHEEGDHPDRAIIVQASRDIDLKAGRKKSHGIFSGVGSKVKHSISKVKKAITGKSSHSKTLPST